MNLPDSTAIGAEAIRFSELFHKGRFHVPWHQRYYDWTDKDVQALLDDIEDAIRENRRCYFLGAVILVEKESDVWEINDGQQRMVTVSLLCAALCRRFAEEIHDSQREFLALRILFNLHSGTVCKLSDAERYEPRMRPPRDDRVRYELIIRGNTIGTNGKLTSAWRVINDFLGVANQNNRWEKYFDYICERLEVACLTVPNDIDPNAVFETINCRGKALDQLDLIRNFFYSHFNTPNERQRRETVHFNLERVRQVFPSTKSTRKAEDYVRCRMQCRFGYLPKDNLYRDVRRTVREQSDRPNDLIFELTRQVAKPEDLELYRRLTIPSASPEFLKEFEVKSGTPRSPRNLTVFLRELKAYSVTQTLVFALMSKFVHESDGRKRRRIARLVNANLSRLSSFVLRTAFVAPKFEPSHFERRFADFASVISNSGGVPDQEFVEFLQECDRAEHNILDDKNFMSIMVNAQMRGNQKIKSLLLGVNRDGRPDAVLLNEATCSVEHILPTGDRHWQGWTEFSHVDANDWTHRIGNLTLMANIDNKPGAKFNRSFATKVDAYRDSSVAITRDLANVDTWSPDVIRNRQEHIAEVAVRVWSFR